MNEIWFCVWDGRVGSVTVVTTNSCALSMYPTPVLLHSGLRDPSDSARKALLPKMAKPRLRETK